MLSIKGQFFFIKSRIVNSKSGKGKSAGYRIYFFVNKNNSCIYLLDFYPKTGKYGKPDLTKMQEKLIVKSFREEFASGTLELFLKKREIGK
ncbi:hypothetical protein [Gynurincola endophyticus]|uniref:hypothetical protein n=1 Tax=Gynurincola endophyticus TaxID=2479004 RepID=UPI000F8E630E|nr:hypothetical protein [Gynurincola endophyticus]